MKDDSALKILKEAILLEQRGQAFYQKVADQSEQADVKAFFKAMAEEEKRHIAILSDQFKAYQAESRFVPTNQNTASDHSAVMHGMRCILLPERWSNSAVTSQRFDTISKIRKISSVSTVFLTSLKRITTAWLKRRSRWLWSKRATGLLRIDFFDRYVSNRS